MTKLWGVIAGLATGLAAGTGYCADSNASEKYRLDPEAVERTLAEAGFTFEKTEVRGVTVCVEKALVGEKKKLVKVVDNYLQHEDKQAAENEKVLKKSGEIIEEINRLTGISAEEKLNEQGELFEFLFKRIRLKQPGREMTLCLVGQEAVKKRMREGQELAGFTYDRETDTVQARIGWYASSKEKGTARIVLPIPLDEKKTVKDLQVVFDRMEWMVRKVSMGAACHELAELNLLMQLKPADPYCRWFSDGFANALAIRLVGKYQGAKKAREFGGLWDQGRREVADKELNLRYWPSKGYGIEADLEGEGALSDARYAAATKEAKRIIDKHGTGVVKKIIEKAAAERPISSERLIEIVKEVTEEDMAARLGRYQTFRTLSEGTRKYHFESGERYGYKGTAKSPEEMKKDVKGTRDMIRLQELSQESPDMYFMLSKALSSRGLAQEVDGAYRQRCLAAMETRDPAAKHWAELFMAYAMEQKRPEIAFEVEHYVLAVEPENMMGLAVKARQLQKEGKAEEAQALAKELIAKGAIDWPGVVREAKLILEEMGIRGEEAED